MLGDYGIGKEIGGCEPCEEKEREEKRERSGAESGGGKPSWDTGRDREQDLVGVHSHMSNSPKEFFILFQKIK